jgi:tetratricopeptide (TPR) repeat protein
MMDEIIIAAETFKGSPLRVLRAEVLNYRMDEAGGNTQEAIVFAQQAIDELSFEIPEDKRALSFRANGYHKLSQLNVNKALQYWQLAIDDLRTAGDFNVWILYQTPKHPVRGLNEAQQAVRAEFNARMAGELLLNPDRIWELLDQGIRMLDGNPNDELERQISRWLQTSLSWNTRDAQPTTLRNAGLLLHKQGNVYQRVDYFVKAIECFESFIDKDPRHAMEVYYEANVWEDWALLNEKQEKNGEEYLVRAWEVYREHEEDVEINFSPLLHYAEFLERLYFNDKISVRPTEAEVLKLAVAAEIMGDGFYSGPGLIQARLAIHRGDTETAIHHLCKLLLLHELCIDTLIKNLRESLTESPRSVVDFLDQALIFMDDVRQGYYFHPLISNAALNEMSREAVFNAWQDRMKEIRNRRS